MATGNLNLKETSDIFDDCTWNFLEEAFTDSCNLGTGVKKALSFDVLNCEVDLRSISNQRNFGVFVLRVCDSPSFTDLF